MNNKAPHICYAVTSSGQDSYADMAYVSARAARIVHPDVNITLLIDEVTDAALKASGSKLLGAADQTIVVQTGLDSAAARSRFVKTSIRSRVSGDFLFIDAAASRRFSNRTATSR